MTLADPMMTAEFAIEQGMRELFACTEFLDEMRRDNEARQSIIANASDIELVRDRLSRILHDVGGRGHANNHNRRKTHCKHGHAYTDDNTLILSTGSRACRTCGKARSKQWRMHHNG